MKTATTGRDHPIEIRCSEIDSNVFPFMASPASLAVGDIVDAVIGNMNEHDLFGVAAG
jgi:hypothetical protein